MSIIEKSLQNLRIDTTQAYKNMQVTPLIMDTAKEKNYLILDEAIRDKVARVVEVSENGNVPTLKFENTSNTAILLLDGEELIGAKQNRIVNLTILVGPERTIDIPVSCVEAGRWQHESDEFKTSDRALYSKVRASKARHVTDSMKSTGSRNSDQDEVWNSISHKMHCMESHSDTAAMSQIFEDNKDSLDDYIEAFSFQENQCGAVFSINGKIKGLEMFDNATSYQLLMRKLLQSYALDAIEESQKAIKNIQSVPQENISQFLTSVGTASTKEFPGTDLGIDLRLDTTTLSGGGLLHEQELIHLCIFPERESTSRYSTMRRASQRGETFH